MQDYTYKNNKEFNILLKNLLHKRNIEEIFEFIKTLQTDERKFVQSGILKLHKFVEKEKFEDLRLINMYSYEEDVYNKGYDYIIGIDEVGRGPFAGPVTVAGVMFKRNDFIRYIDDSKKLNKDMKESLNNEISKKAIDKVILSASNSDIDKRGIKVCTLDLMRQCVEYFVNRGYSNIFVLVDAEKIPNISVPQINIIKGDSKSASIAGASILAKVYRDSLMEEFSYIYPEYEFFSNAGYNSDKHFQAILDYGICPIHRKSFVKTALRNKGVDINKIGFKYNIDIE